MDLTARIDVYRSHSLIHTFTYSLILITIISLNSCKKTNSNEGKLKFSEEQVMFDTVFTSIGSTYRVLKVYNPNKYLVKTNVQLAGGQNSFFSVNVDGLSGTVFSDIEIPAKDSIFIFVKVTINPQNQDNPYLIKDSLVFKVGDIVQDVDLLACGQDAHFIVGDTDYAEGIKYKIVARSGETVTWTKERPYVIYGWAVVDEGGRLIIEEGTRVYLHDNARLWVYQGGNIKVNGTKDSPVTFQGDTELNSFDLHYAKWDRIWICEGSEDNEINYAEISNAFVGIHVEPLDQGTISSNRTFITNTIIKNTQNAAIIGKRAKVSVENSVLANNGGGSALFMIGDFTLKHTSISNRYDNYPNRSIPALYVANIIEEDNKKRIAPTTFYGANNIIDGSLLNECMLVKNDEATLSCLFENCLIKLQDVGDDRDKYINTLFNSAPKFKNSGTTDIKQLDLRLQSGSPAIGIGKAGVTTLGVDFDGNTWAASPAAGAYEYMP